MTVSVPGKQGERTRCAAAVGILRSAVLLFAIGAVNGHGSAQDSDLGVAGTDQVADIIKNYEGRGTLSDGSEPTPPEEAREEFRVRDGFEIDLVASEPIIGQPLHISWDSRGRMWVTQYLQYQFPAGLKIVEYDNHLRAQFDKVPEPPPHGTPGADKITVFEDTDGDGLYDSHRDVITGLNIATSCVTGAGGIWVSNPPYLLFYPDADDDAVPDSDPQVRLSGFGIEDTHSVMNSLKWGADGWLYGVNGSTTTGKVENPANGKMVEWQGQMIWRYHPETEWFEIWAEGGGNTFSLEVDSAGRVFSGTNNGNTRGMYYPQGAYGKKGWGKHGPLTNPYAFGYINHMKHEGDDRRFAQAFCIYEGGLFPEEWDGKIIAPNSLHNIVWSSELIPEGSTFRTVDEEPLVESGDRWFRPVFAGVGPDGCVYIADWYDTRQSHVRPVDDWHKESGRIYRIRPVGTNPKTTHADLAKAGVDELREHLEDPNWVVRKRALLEWGWRHGDAPFDPEFPIEGSPVKLGASRFSGYLEQYDPEAGPFASNRWSIRAMRESLEEMAESMSALDGQIDVNDKVRDTLVDEVLFRKADEEVGVRAELAASAKRLPARFAVPVIRKLLTYEEDFDDLHVPLLIWWAIEAHAESAREEILDLAADSETWDSKIFREFIAERLARRYAMARGEENLLSAADLLKTAPDDDAKQRLMTGIQLAFQGSSVPELPGALEREMDAWAKSSGGSGLALAIRRGDGEALKKALGVVASSSSDPIERLELARVFGEIGDPVVVPVLLKLLSLDQESALKRVALQSLANYDDPRIPSTILARHGSTLPAEHGVRSTAHRVLAGRVEWAKAFLEKVELAHIKARNVSSDVVQLLAQHGDPEIDAAIRELWPNSIEATSEETRQEIARIREVVAAGEGDPALGKAHFAARCAACHVLFGEGREVGPDLTPYERQNLDFWLPGIVAPSLELREGYLQFVATMKDGLIVLGMMREQTPQTVTLRDLVGQETTLGREEMESLVASPVSLMPPGLLSGMSDEELRDLFAYLRKAAP